MIEVNPCTLCPKKRKCILGETCSEYNGWFIRSWRAIRKMFLEEG